MVYYSNIWPTRTHISNDQEVAKVNQRSERLT